LINHLKVNVTFVTDKKEVAELITDKKEVAELTATNHSKKIKTENSSSEFERVKMIKEKRCLDFSSKNKEEYNLPF